MVDLAIHKALNKTRSIEGQATTIAGVAYTAGQTVTLTLPGARVERIYKAQGIKPVYRGISKSNWDTKDATTTIYDYKQRDWIWRIKGAYSTTSFTGSHNFYTDLRLIIDDGGSIMITLQDQESKVFPMQGEVVWEGGMLHVVEYTIDFIEGFERATV